MVRRYGLLIIVSVALGLLFALYISYSEGSQFATKYIQVTLSTLLISLIVFQVDWLLDRFISWRNNFLVRFFVGFLANTVVSVSLVALASRYLINSNTESTLKVSILFAISIF